MRRVSLTLLAVGVAVAVAPVRATADDTVDYVVEDGDTCMAIAVRVLGDRNAYKRIHELNPQLGPLPHDLKAGQVLKLPGKGAPSGPDAVLSRARGDVKVRKPDADDWGAAERGMDLFRAWRVGAAERAAAELTFRDRAKLRLRERTIVIIYGPQKQTAKVIAARAELEEGTLEARLDELGGQRVAVQTPGADAEVGEGRAVVSVDGAGTSIVANHDGGEIAVRGKKPGGKAVKVKAGMGSRVKKGKPPEKPRPLPPAPGWDPATGDDALALAVGRDAAPLAVTWTEVATAARYRIAVDDASGEAVAAIEVTAPATGGATEPLPPGRYRVEVSAIDAEGFESKPSAPRELEVVTVAIVPPGGGAPVALDGAAVALGAEVIAPAGATCTVGDASGARVRLDDTGVQELTCAFADGRVSAAAPLEIAPVTAAVAGVPAGGQLHVARGATAVVVVELASAGTIGDGLDVRASDGLVVEQVVAHDGRLEVHVRAAADAPAGARLDVTAGDATIATVAVVVDEAVRIDEPAPFVPAPRARPARWTIGAFGGVHALGAEVADALGDPIDADHRLTSGPIFGARGTRRLGAPWLVEAELAMIPTALDQAAGVASIVSFRGQAGVALDDGALGARVLLGAGGHMLAFAPEGTLRETELFVTWGAALTRALGGGATVRLDARDQLFRGPRGVVHDVELVLGVSIDVGSP